MNVKEEQLIEENARLREELRRSREAGYEKRFRILAETAPDAIIITDAGQRILFANPATRSVFGYEAAFLAGKDIRLLIPDFAGRLGDSGMSGNGGTGYRSLWNAVELSGRRADGTEIPLEISLGEFRGDGEDIYSAIVRDISGRKGSEREVHSALERERELSELQSRFISIMSHEFRTPLSTILSSSELIEHYGESWTREKILKHLHRIQDTVRNMADILDDVLIIGKAGAGKLEFQPSFINVGYYSSELAEEVRVGDKGRHTIVFESAARDLRAWLDEKLLRHIIVNLLSNAVKYSPEGSTVNFRLYTAENSLVFEVEDRGIGIPPEEQKFLFEAFHRASNTGTIEGTGLGLVIVKRAVDLHGGSVEVESEPGRGTIFRVYLPFLAGDSR